MNDFMSPEAISQALLPVLIAFASFVVSVFSGFLFLNNRNKREINRVDSRNVELTKENEQVREDLRMKEDTLHAMRRELDDLRNKLESRDRQLEMLTAQLTELTIRSGKLEDRITETQGLLESERKFAQGRIDAEAMARQKAELKAAQLEAEIKVMRAEKDALAQRLEDQSVAYKAEMTALQERAARLEAESRLLSASINDRIRTATLPLMEQVEALRAERSDLVTRVCELEAKGADPDA